MELDDKDIEMIIFKGKLYRCPLCPKAFRGRASTKEHFNTDHRGFRFRCPCGKEYTKKPSHDAHVKKCKFSIKE